MQPKERRETGEQDLFRSRLDQIIDLQHALVRLARAIDWRFLEEKFGAVYTDKPGHPPLPTRLMAGLAILKHMQDLSDEALCEHWVENPYYQLSLPETRFACIDDGAHQGLGVQQHLRTTRSRACRARPSRAKHEFVRHYNRRRISLEFVEGALRWTRSDDQCTRAGSTRSGVQHGHSARANGTTWVGPGCPSLGCEL